MNCAAQLMSGVGKSEHITLVLKCLPGLLVEQQLMLKILCLTYKALHVLAPSYLSEILVKYKPARSLCSSDQSLLSVLIMRLKKIGARAFSSVAPSLYNDIPLKIHQS